MSTITKAWRYLRHGPSHFMMYVFGRLISVRSVVQRLNRSRTENAALKPATPAQETSALESIDVDCAASAVRRDGYFSGLRLVPEVLDDLRRFSTTSICFAEGDAQFPFLVGQRSQAEQNYGKRIQIGRFDHAMQNCPEAQVLASDPMIVAIARRYLGCHPVFLGARIWWSFPTDAGALEQMSMGQGFHYDLDGYASLAFFFYLTDVDCDSGPHILVRGSHLSKPWKGILSLHRGRPNAVIEEWYGKESQVMLCGSAGFGFAEDLFCYHKGLHPERGERLILQLRYGIRKYYEG